MYFKEDGKSKANFAVILEMMKLAFPDEHGGSIVFAVLDVSSGKIHLSTEVPSRITPLLHGEARSFVGMWEAL
ncbi:hypothetical protein D3C86_1722880 [compost metagenome]